MTLQDLPTDYTEEELELLLLDIEREYFEPVYLIGFND